MDTAGNCDTTAVELKTTIPTFSGAAARLRCFFLKELKRKKVVKVGKGRANGYPWSTNSKARGARGRCQDLHDTHVARSVAGLAKKAHDSGTVADTFNSPVDVAKVAGKIQSDKTALDCRCPTRWDPELACLYAYNVLKVAVEQLTATTGLKLSPFKLTKRQWSLSDEVTDVLSLFDEMTQYFSQAETPLISDTICALEDLILSLRGAQADPLSSSVVYIAACTAVMVVEKYFSLNDDCEVYAIAIGKYLFHI
ncbi:hypothetical protein DFH09DRAFT_1250264 [Mycena vulgaris]|nr:hypothetical protein DFH09DRAFT_1250264 [Mycena vulgaris]